MSRNITLAFAGSGEVKKKTVEALLDDFLGFGPKDADGFPEPSEHEISVILPASAEHYNDSLQTVVDWTEYADLPYDVVLAKGDRDDSLEALVSDAEHVTEAVNVDKALIDALSAAAGEKFLVLAWNDDDEHCEILLDLADTAGIKAVDLTEGLDDLSFDDGTAEEPEKEPEPEEKPARGRRGSRKAADEPEEAEAAPEPEKPVRGRRRAAKEEALEETEEALEEEVPEAEPEPTPEPVAEAPKRRGRARAAEEPKAEVTAADVAKSVEATDKADVVLSVQTVDAEYLSGALQSIFLHLQATDNANGYKNLMDPYESPVTTLAREALEHVSLSVPVAAEEPEEEPKRGRGRPRTTVETTGYLVNGDGVYRKAPKGRPKRGETKVDLTADEVARLTAEGLILDED